MAVAKINGQVVCPVVEKKVPETKYGVNINQVLPVVSAEGVASVQPLPSMSFDGLVTINQYALFGRFARSDIVMSPDATGDVVLSFPDLEHIKVSGLAYFAYSYSYQVGTPAGGIILSMPKLVTIETQGMQNFLSSVVTGNGGLVKSIDFSSLSTVGTRGLENAFMTSTYISLKLSEVFFPALTSVDNNGMSKAFYNQSKLATVGFPVLEKLAGNAFSLIFYMCTSLTTLYFPALTSTAISSFGTSTSNYAFNGCTGLTEIHFRADAQATIEAMTGYADKWGASNATIYFDL